MNATVEVLSRFGILFVIQSDRVLTSRSCLLHLLVPGHAYADAGSMRDSCPGLIHGQAVVAGHVLLDHRSRWSGRGLRGCHTPLG